MAEIKLKEIALDKIDANPENNELFTMDNIDHLARIIDEEGFTTPIEVFKKDDGRYEITSGHRRYEAMKLLGQTTIPCYVTDKYKSSTQKDRKLLSSNIAARRLSPLEMAKAITFYKAILKKEKYKGNVRKKVAEYFNISESNVYRYECLLNLIPELQEFCKKPLFPYSSLRQAATLTPEEQHELYEELKKRAAIENDKNLDEIDKDEIVFSRTVIELIINNKIRKIENEHKRAEKSEEVAEPIQEVEEQASNNDMSQYIIHEDETPVYSLDDVLNGNASETELDNTYLNGFDSCIATIKAYKKNSMTNKNKDVVRKKISELRKEIDKLESLLK